MAQKAGPSGRDEEVSGQLALLHMIFALAGIPAIQGVGLDVLWRSLRKTTILGVCDSLEVFKNRPGAILGGFFSLFLHGTRYTHTLFGNRFMSSMENL